MRATLAMLKLAVTQLLAAGYVYISTFESQWGINFTEYFAADLERVHMLVGDGLVEVSPVRIFITPKGRFLARIVAMCFDRYLRVAKITAQYSRVI